MQFVKSQPNRDTERKFNYILQTLMKDSSQQELRNDGKGPKKLDKKEKNGLPVGTQLKSNIVQQRRQAIQANN